MWQGCHVEDGVHNLDVRCVAMHTSLLSTCGKESHNPLKCCALYCRHSVDVWQGQLAEDCEPTDV